MQVASDYDSEAYYTTPAPPARDRDDINFTVLKRYEPQLEAIIVCAPHAKVYTLQDGEWVVEEVEGSLFICRLTPSPITGGSRYCLMMLNRKGMDNLIIEFGKIANMEVPVGANGERFLMLKFQSQENAYMAEIDPAMRDEKIIGLFLHCDEHPSQQEILDICLEHFDETILDKKRAEIEGGIFDTYAVESLGSIEPNGAQIAPMGRRLSLSELFGHR